MASLITLSGVISPSQFPMVSYIVPSLGAIIAIVSGVIGLYKFQENWLEYRTVSESLKHEKYLFLTRSEPYHEAVPFNLFVNRVENIISEGNSKWSQTMKEVGKEKEPEKDELNGMTALRGDLSITGVTFTRKVANNEFGLVFALCVYGFKT